MNKRLTKTLEILRVLRTGDFQGFARLGKYYHQNFLERKKYQTWVARFDTLSAESRRQIKIRIEALELRPKISVLMPVYNTPEKWLRLAIESVRRQLYENWELCVADDFSPSPHVRRILEEYAQKDARVKIVFRRENGHISAASNSALALAAGEFTALLDHDDELAEHALYAVAEEINRFPASDLIYSDEDLIGENGKRRAPKFKPDFSADLMLSLNLPAHLSVYRTEILRRIGGFRAGFEGSQDYDLALRVIEQIPEKHIRHIPQILYHWRSIKGSVALGIEEKPYAHERARKAIREHLERKNVRAEVTATHNNLHRVSYKLPVRASLADLILCAGARDENLFETIESVINNTSYPNFQIRLGVISGEKTSENLKRRLEIFKNEIRLKIIFLKPEKTSFADSLNEIAAGGDGEILVFLDGGILTPEADWLQELVTFAMQPQIGAAGAKTSNRNGTIKHGGVIFGVNNLAANAHENLPPEAVGNLWRTKIINNFSAVSGACLATRREIFEGIAGFDAKNFPNGLYDADLCLRLREKGFRIVFTPYAALVQTRDSATEKIVKDWKNQKGGAPEIERFQQRWRNFIENDPFYNPNLSLENANFSVALPPRLKKDWRGR